MEYVDKKIEYVDKTILDTNGLVKKSAYNKKITELKTR